MKRTVLLFGVAMLLASMCVDASAQTTLKMGGNMGLSVVSAGGGSAAGFQIGPAFEMVFDRNFAIGTEFNINTQTGTPLEWADYFKYYFTIKGSQVRPYADFGFNLWFYTGGPYFGLRFGGGADIPVARNLSVTPDVVLGPVFASGTTPFYFALRGGLKYSF